MDFSRDQRGYLAVGCIALLRKKNALSKNKRILALVFLALCAAGTAVRYLFSVPVELLSEAVAVFGMMVLLEEDGANLKRNDESLWLSCSFWASASPISFP